MIALLLIVILIAVVLEVRSLKRSVYDISYRMEPSKRSVEQGEEFLLKTTLENVSRENISYLFVEEAIPEEVELPEEDSMKLVLNGAFRMCQSILFLKRRQRIRRNVRAVVHKRGIIKFHYAKVKIGDFLGIKELERIFRFNRSVVVYPIKLEDERLEQVLSDVMGEVSVNSFMYEDPILVKGYRDYTGREPLRAISFPVSAKRNQLTVKEFDHTREEMVDLIFDVRYKGDFDHFFAQQEASFAMVRTICERLEERGISYRLITNAYYAAMEVHGVNVIQSGGTGGSSFVRILDMLGTASNAAMCETEELLAEAFKQFSQEKSFIYLCHRREEETESTLAKLKQRCGTEIHCLYGEDYEELYLQTAEKIKYKAGDDPERKEIR